MWNQQPAARHNPLDLSKKLMRFLSYDSFHITFFEVKEAVSLNSKVTARNFRQR